ncbi:MAG TPA: hypothetical protein VN929_07380 [Burkholderiales bacterium]|nr:hypothetical protein [Burkholderiales bacterium]
MKLLHRSLMITLMALPGVALSAADVNQPAMPGDPVLERVAAATSKNDWTGAQATLREALAKNPSNADYHNLYAYTLRKGANPDMSLVFSTTTRRSGSIRGTAARMNTSARPTSWWAMWRKRRSTFRCSISYAFSHARSTAT